ncbi:MAG: MarR family winged helix-turn-helix transcriptional regulator [Pirellulaceae bacterium]
MPDVVDDLDQIGFLLGRAYYSYVGLLQQWLESAGLAGHLKPGMGSLLFALFREDGRTITEIADELQLAKSTMTGMVARMREAGLITTETDANDGRVQRLQLTPLAKSLKPKCRKMAGEMERLLGRHLTPAAQQQFRAALATVTRTIAEELQATGTGTARTKLRQSQRARVMNTRIKQRPIKHSEKTR